jgi:hypothetical protein
MILALAGRLIDPVNLKKQRFPENMEDTVRERILECLRAEKPAVLVSSAACGADLLAQDAASELDIERHVILPFDRRRFRLTSVERCPGIWGPVFDRLCDESEAQGNLVTLRNSLDETEAYAAATIAILDHAEGLEPDAIAAAVVWEGAARNCSDESSAFMKEAQRRNIRVIEISTLP